MVLTDFLSLLAQGLLILTLPFVIAAAIQHFRVMTQQLRSKLNENQQQAVDRAVSVAVKAAEQVGGIEGLIGPEKKKQAIKIAQDFLAERGVKLDVGKLVNLIEAEVQTQYRKPEPVADTAGARQALIDSALQAAVSAAEQSGLTGLIQNVGAQKKAYAIQLANQYLSQYGINVDPTLLDGLIESQVMRSAAQGQIPPSASAGVAPPAPAYSIPTSPGGIQPGG